MRRKTPSFSALSGGRVYRLSKFSRRVTTAYESRKQLKVSFDQEPIRVMVYVDTQTAEDIRQNMQVALGRIGKECRQTPDIISLGRNSPLPSDSPDSYGDADLDVVPVNVVFGTHDSSDEQPQVA